MRKFDGYGMDNPYGYGNYAVCVGQGDVISFPLNSGSALPSAVDDLKVVVLV